LEFGIYRQSRLGFGKEVEIDIDVFEGIGKKEDSNAD
jgi:hypothetical protein